MTFDREQLAWAAGLFEGEGCLSFTRRPNGSLRNAQAILRMTDEDTVRSFQQALGFGTIYAYPKRREHWKPTWDWKASTFELFQMTVILLWPWLKSRRRAKAVKVLQQYHAAEPVRTVKRTYAIAEALDALDSTPLWGRRWQPTCRTQADIAREFGVSAGTVSLIKQKRGALRLSTK